MTKQIVFLIIYLAEAFISYIYFSDNFESRKTTLKSILIASALFFAGFLINLTVNNNIVVNLITFLLINFIYSKISFDILTKSALFHSSLLTAVMAISEITVESIINSIINIPVKAYNNKLTALIIISVISKTLYLLICLIVGSLNSDKKNYLGKISKSFPLYLYPIIVMFILVIYFYTSIIYEYSNSLNILCSAISVISLIFCCFIFIYNQKIQRQESELISLQSEKQKNEINQTFYDLLEQKNEEQKVLVHDIKHHFSAINSMDNAEDIKSYLSEIQSEFDEYQYIGKSKNNMLDLILDKYSHICITNNIDFTADVRSSNLSFINDNDLTSLLSNLLDNAVEAATGVENASIRFATKKERSFDILSVINSSSHSPKARGGKLISTKTDSAFHGYGTKSIEKTAKKYNGNCLWEYEENDKTFHYTIIFNKQ